MKAEQQPQHRHAVGPASIATGGSSGVPCGQPASVHAPKKQRTVTTPATTTMQALANSAMATARVGEAAVRPAS